MEREYNQTVMGIVLVGINGFVFVFAIGTLSAIVGPAFRDCKKSYAKNRQKKQEDREKQEVLTKKYQNTKTKGSNKKKATNKKKGNFGQQIAVPKGKKGKKNNSKVTPVASNRRGAKSKSPPPPAKKRNGSKSNRGGRK